MPDYSAIKYVTGAVSLAAFVILVVAGVVMRAISRDVDILRHIRGSKEEIEARQRIAALLLERFVVDTSDLSSADRRDLALKQLDERRRRIRTIFILAGFICLCATIVAVIAMGNTR